MEKYKKSLDLNFNPIVIKNYDDKIVNKIKEKFYIYDTYKFSDTIVLIIKKI